MKNKKIHSQQDLYEIEEKKLMKPQEFIDLSLKLKRRTSNLNKSNEMPQVRKIDVAEISSRVDDNQAETMDVPTENNGNHSQHKHMTRVAKKMHAVQVQLQRSKLQISIIFNTLYFRSEFTSGESCCNEL